MIIPSVESLLKKHRIRLKKRWGQHFLTRKPTLEKIINALGVRHSDDVLEIGAGLGVMTAMTAPLAHTVYAVEKDKTLAAIFEEEFGHIKNIRYLCADFLQLDFKKDLAAASFPLKIIGNIPYNISTPILFKLLENKSLISSAVLMVQLEVARRMLARPNTKDYGILAILTQTQTRIRKLFEIRPTCFVPPPKVISAVIRLDFELAPEWEIDDPALFKKLVKSAFGQRRKTLKNSLAQAPALSLSLPLVMQALKDVGIDPQRRPETLLINEYIALANRLARSVSA